MTVHLTLDGAVAVLTLDRPEALNALDVTALRTLRAHLTEIRDRARYPRGRAHRRRHACSARARTSKGTRTSPASYAEALFQAPDPAADLGLYIRLMDLSGLAFWKPLIAAVNGHCLGAGLEMALQCDMRIASDNATFGLARGSGSARFRRCPASTGCSRPVPAAPMAMQMVLTGERIDAAEAHRIGLVSETVPAAMLRRAGADAGAPRGPQRAAGRCRPPRSCRARPRTLARPTRRR